MNEVKKLSVNSHTKNLYKSIDERIDKYLNNLKDPFLIKPIFEKIIIALGNNIKHNSPVLIFANGDPQI